MAKAIKYEASLWDMESALKGIISGSMMIGSAMNPYGVAVQSILFIFGFFVLLDSLMPNGKVRYTMTIMLFFFVGAIATFIISILNNAMYWMLLMILGAAIFYLIRISKYFFRER